MKRITVLILLMFAPVLGFSRGYVVGNGGDGYHVSKNIFVTDLLEVGLENTVLPDKGPVSPRIARELATVDIGFDFPRNKMAIKLSELDVRAPGMATALILSMKSYRWRMVNVPIGLVEDLEGRTVGLPDSDRVQIAVRLGALIRVQAQVWAELNETHQVALLLHECFYSLVAPRLFYFGYPAKGMDIQSSRQTRELTGLAFDGNDSENRLLDEALSVLGTNIIGKEGPGSQQWQLHTRHGSATKSYALSLFDSTSATDVSSFIAATCKAEFAKPSTAVVAGRLATPKISVDFVPYTSPYGELTALGIRADYKAGPDDFSLNLSSEAECKSALAAKAPSMPPN